MSERRSGEDRRGSVGPTCPNCGDNISKVLQSRALICSDDLKRRRECCSCRARFTSREIVEQPLEKSA